VFVDPVIDLAVLSAVDDQEMPDEAEAYDRLVDALGALRIMSVRADVDRWEMAQISVARGDDDDEFGSEEAGRMLDLGGEWFGCKVWHCGGALSVRAASQPIMGGMSGSPILNNEGAAIGVVTVSGGSGDVDTHTEGGSMPRLTDHLPRWFMRMCRAGRDEA
jgi:hypothetical protein